MSKTRTPADDRIDAAVRHAAELAAENQRKRAEEKLLVESSYEERDPEKRRR